jgi:L-lysine exporter family protein LysE/ArgO
MQVSAGILEGLILGAGLFAAIGPKDAFVIRQSLLGQYVFTVVVICVLGDVLLIAVGVAGTGRMLAAVPSVLSAVLWGGAAYLCWFGGQRLLAAICNRSMPDPKLEAPADFRQTIKAALGFALLNPYAWLDTVVLIGSIAGSKPTAEQQPFALGTMSASLIWFFLLAYGTQRLRSLFKLRIAWRLLDLGVAGIMFFLAAQIAVERFQE